MKDFNFWEECVSESLDEQGISATKEQIAAIAKDMSLAHENYGMAFYQPENPYRGELAEAKKALATGLIKHSDGGVSELTTVTQWFDRDTKPVNIGLYPSTAFEEYNKPPICFWDGEQWLTEDKKIVCPFQYRAWRGLAVKPRSGIK